MASDTRTTDHARAPLSTDAAAKPAVRPAASRAALSVVEARFVLAQPDAPAPADWQSALDELCAWLGLTVEWTPESQLCRPGQARAPVFAPWLAWSPSAFQHGGLAGLPQADWAVSYLVDPGAGLNGAAARGIDLALMSPLPSACLADGTTTVPAPRSEVLRAMLRAAGEQGRTRVAIICNAPQRNAIVQQLPASCHLQNPDLATFEIVAIEDALRPLIDGAAPWDAVIAMPDLRSIVFALLSETTGVRGPWPLLWHCEGDAPGPVMVTSEIAGDGQSRIALDASVLVQALALTCQSAGIHRAARRLHSEWARLRDGGIATAGRGTSAPYARRVSDAEFVAMLTTGLAASRRDVPRWRALGETAASPLDGKPRGLRVVATTAPALTSSQRA